MADPQYDVFVSYHWAASLTLARRLHDALVALGLKVFFDEAEIEDFASITARLTTGLAKAKALVALYSATYPGRRACQFELTAAFLAGQRGGNPRERVLVVNPEPGVDHIEPVALRDALFARAPAPGDAVSVADLAGRIERHVRSLDGPLGDIHPLAPPPWYGQPAAGSTRFVGRLPALWAIHSALHAGELRPLTGRAGPGLAQVVGMAGIGKTLLAEEYAMRFGPAYPGGVFWLRAGAAPTEAERDSERGRQIRVLAIEYGIPLARLTTPVEVAALLRWRIEERGQPCLWVVDDVPGGLGADELRRWWAPHPLAVTLLTTQRRDYGALAVAVEPGLLTPAESGELLAAHRRPTGEAETAAAEALAVDLGHHALALDVAGAAVRFEAGSTPYARFRAALAHPTSDELEAAAELADALPTGHEPSIAATLARSIGRLGPEGIDLLRLAAGLAPVPIPASFVDAVLGRADGLDERAARTRGRQARRQVEGASLAEPVGDGHAHTVHGLVSRTVRFRGDRPERRTQLRTAAIELLREELPEAVTDVRLHAGIEVLVAHARELAAEPEDVDEAELLGEVARYDLERGAFASSATLFRRLCEVLTRLLGPEHPDTLTAMGNLAGALHHQGDLRAARELQEQVLEASRRALGLEHPNTLMAMGNLAGTLREQGDLPGARELEAHVLDARRRVLGPEHPDTLRAMGNLAGTLHHQGDLVGAQRLQIRVLKASRRLLGADHPQTLRARNNLAMMLLEKGDLVGARRLQEQVLDARRRVLGPEHPATLRAMGNFAVTLGRQSDLAGARDLQEQVLEASRRLLGPEHSETLKAKGNLAGSLRDLGDLAGARKLGEEVVHVSRRVLGPEHPDTLGAMNSLVVTLMRQGKFRTALRIEARVLDGIRLVLGPDHPHTLAAAETVTFLRRMLDGYR